LLIHQIFMSLSSSIKEQFSSLDIKITLGADHTSMRIFFNLHEYLQIIWGIHQPTVLRLIDNNPTINNNLGPRGRLLDFAKDCDIELLVVAWVKSCL